MALEYVYRALVAAQYTGAQSAADVAAAAQQITQFTGNTWTVQSDDGVTLVLRETGAAGNFYDWPIRAGQVVVVDPSIGIVDRLPVEAFLARYRRADAVSDATLVRGLNTPAWITALKAKLAAALT